MAIVVQSTSSANTSSSASLVITKPSGLAEGEVLIAVICIFDTTDDIAVPSGWTELNSSSCSDGEQKVLGKIADASDVAASNFNFTTTPGSASIIAGGIMRVSGVNGLLASLSDADTNNSHSGGSISFSTDLSPVYDNSLWIISTTTNDGNAGNNDIYNYFATGSSVSFTELFTIGGAELMGAAYGTQTAAASATAYGYQFGQDGSPFASVDNHGAALTILYERVDPVVSNSLLETNPFFSPAAISNTNTVSNALLEVSPTINNASASVRAKTLWTNETKPTTNWSNEQKNV